MPGGGLIVDLEGNLEKSYALGIGKATNNPQRPMHFIRASF